MMLHYKSLLPVVAVLLTLLTSACKSKPIEKLNYYSQGGQVSRRYFMVDDKIEGTMTEYYPDGKLKMERLFEHGVQVGRTVFYYPEGAIKEAQYFVNGTQQGGDTLWYPDGRVQFVTGYKDGKRDGWMRKWTSEGALIVDVRYEMDSIKEVISQIAKPQTADNK